MFKNHLLIAFRHLLKNIGYTTINVLGLAIGLAACLLIWRILHYETSYNHNFAHHERIGRTYMRTFGNPSGDRPDRGVTVPAMIEFKEKIKDIEAAARIREDWPTITVDNPAGGAPIKKISSGEANLSMFVEPDFFKIFDLKWLAGGAERDFAEVGSTALSRSSAEKLFGSAAEALGKNITLDNNVPSIVRGVYEDIPQNCDFPVYSLTSYATLRAHKDLYYFAEDEWGSTSSNDQLFFLLKDKSQFTSLAAAVAEVGKSHFEEAGSAKNIKARIEMQALDDVHFDEEIGSSVKPTIARTRLWTLATIGLLVLVMACFNFINLATALAASRAREVGVRKAVGGQKSTLVMQFMTETGLVTLFSLVLGCFLARIAAPFLKKISDLPDDLPFFSDTQVWVFLAIVGVVVVLLSGLWPSLVLAGLAPVKALRNNAFSSGERGFSLRKALIVTQFVIAQALLVVAVITVSQMDYLQKMDIGVSKDLVLTARFNNDSTSLTKLSFLKNQLQQIPSVESVSFSTDEPTSGSTWSSNFAVGRGKDESFSTTMKFIDADFAKTYGLKMAAGRWLEPSDTTREYVVNESLLKKVGIASAAEAIGQEMRLGGGRFRTICGVVKDFHTKSAHTRSRQNEPLVLAPNLEFYSHLSVKIRPDDIPKTQEAIQKAYDQAFPEQVFYPRFFDETIADFYQKEAQFSAFAKGIAFLSVIIGCLGLFGLASYMAAKRRKEIGIRKVLGATVAGITGLLAADFLKLVVIAIAIASPLAFYFMRGWLADFAYRIDIQWWMFALAGAAAVLIAFLTVGFQSVKAALANPVKSLRSE